MQFWWVNQNQTYQHEISGGYLWSPKVKANGNINPFYDNMSKVGIGDIVFSFKNTLILAIGIITSEGYSHPKPSTFGAAGENWDNDGWCVDVDYHELINKIRPKDFINKLAVTLPSKYSPLQENGNGNQAVYLAAVPQPMDNVLMELIGKEAYSIINNIRTQDIVELEESTIEKNIRQNTSLEHTEKEQLVKSRCGQGIFRTNLERIEKACRITGLTAKEHLRASHIKPWRDATNFERLDGNNGLLLSPHIDALFDKGYISFSDNGALIVSNATDKEVIKRWCIPSSSNVGSFNDQQKLYLAYHRVNIFKAK